MNLHDLEQLVTDRAQPIISANHFQTLIHFRCIVITYQKLTIECFELQWKLNLHNNGGHVSSSSKRQR